MAPQKLYESFEDYLEQTRPHNGWKDKDVWWCHNCLGRGEVLAENAFTVDYCKVCYGSGIGTLQALEKDYDQWVNKYNSTYKIYLEQLCRFTKLVKNMTQDDIKFIRTFYP